MKNSLVMSALMVSAVALAGCSIGQESICNTVPALADDLGDNPASKMNDPVWLERRASNCVMRWAYRLAPSPDAGETVAKAVVQACELAINEHARDFAKGLTDQMVASYPSGTIDQTERNAYYDDLFARRLAYFDRDANFRVQQGRAGKCKV